MNPCPCGYYGDSRRACICSGAQIHRYRTKVSGPLARQDRHTDRRAVRDHKGTFPRHGRGVFGRYPREGDGGAGYPSGEIQGKAILGQRADGRPIRQETLRRPGRRRRSCSNTQSKSSACLPGPIIGSSRYRGPLRIWRANQGYDESHVAEAIQYRLLDKKMTM